MNKPKSQLRRLREQKGLSLQEVAEELGVTKMTVHYHETGQRELSPNAIAFYRRRYGVKSHELFVAPEHALSAN